jgi:hypothetical protein
VARVVIACEFSGTVRDAFLRRGHDAISVDLLPTESPGPHHQGDIFEFLNDHRDCFDLLIGHPECTYLCNSGVRWLSENPDRWNLMVDGAQFFKRLLNWPVKHKALENPIMHRYAASIIGRRQSQSVQPYYFGDKKLKRTCLWLDNLPPLEITNYVGPAPPAGTKWYGEWAEVHHAAKGPERWKLRSRTYPGFADAMATQWGDFVNVQLKTKTTCSTLPL